MNTIKLTDKELWLTWHIVCWFDKPVTSALKYKLSKMAFSTKRKEWDKKFSKQILLRILSVAESIKQHPEWLEDSL